jgi:alanine racemase
MRPSWVEVDLDAVRYNVSALARLIRPAQLCAVVKADAYGHGDVPVAEASLEAGATWLAVALLEEGIRLREAGVSAPILLLSEPAHTDAEEVVHWDLTPTVYRSGFIQALSKAGASRIQIKVDTGMHRVGAQPSELADLFDASTSAGLEVEGLWSHFAASEEDAAFTQEQVDRFDNATAGLIAPMVHLANTAGGVLFPQARRHMVRAGIGIYGIHPGPATTKVVDLRPAMKILSRVSYVQRLPTGSRPSYGRRRALAADSTVATVPIGYADGVPRAISAEGDVLIRGERFPLAGTVTMDQTMVDVGDEAVEVGDEVVLIGRQGSEEISADEWAIKVGTIAYEIVCQIGPRLPRRYLT